MYVSISIYIVYHSLPALRSNLRAAFARLMKIYRKRIKFIAESQVSFAFLPLENRTKEGPLSTSPSLFLSLPSSPVHKLQVESGKIRRLQPGHNGLAPSRHVVHFYYARTWQSPAPKKYI